MEKKHLLILENELKALKQEENVRGVMLMGSVAYGKAVDDSDLDILVLCDRDVFISKCVDDITVEVHYQTYETLTNKLKTRPMEVYKYLYSKILFDDGGLEELSLEANNRYNSYKTPEKEKESICYWLLSTKSKLLSSIERNEVVKIAYLVSTNTWKVLEGVWAINNKPIPPTSIVYNTYYMLSFPLENWFYDLFMGDVLSRAYTMIKIIDLICEYQ